jgi:signal peptidase I
MSEPREPASQPGAFSIALLSILVFAFVGVVIVFYVTHSTSKVNGPSMEPTLVDGDVTLVGRGYSRPLRGDVIVIRPRDSSGQRAQNGLIKRVIATPGDRVEVASGRVMVNGAPEMGEYTVVISEGDLSYPLTTLGPNEVFVLGDNRPVSGDSRVFGPVPLEDIEGKARVIIAPLSRIRFVR